MRKRRRTESHPAPKGKNQVKSASPLSSSATQCNGKQGAGFTYNGRKGPSPALRIAEFSDNQIYEVADGKSVDNSGVKYNAYEIRTHSQDDGHEQDTGPCTDSFSSHPMQDEVSGAVPVKAGMRAGQMQGPGKESQTMSQRGNLQETKLRLDPAVETRRWLQRRGVPVLGLMARHLLEVFAGCHAEELLQPRNGASSWIERTWTGLFTQFERTCGVYELTQPHNGPFMDAYIHNELNEEARMNLYTINLAIATSILFRISDLSFLALHQHYLELFAPAGEPLDVWQINLLVAIKLECFRSGYSSADTSSDEPFQYLYVDALNKRFDTNNSTPEQSHAVGNLVQVLNYIRGAAPTELNIPSIIQRSLADSVRQVLPDLKQFLKDKLQLQGYPDDANGATGSESGNVAQELQESGNIRRSTEAFATDDATAEPGMNSNYDSEQDEMVRRAALAAHAALMGQAFSESLESPGPQAKDSSMERDVQINELSTQYCRLEDDEKLQALSPETFLEGESTSTKEQYERARQVASDKAAAKVKANLQSQSQRRPWTHEEENALMTGLDRVQGPHWSQILAMYGAGGTVSEVLKDRNQVQLKDKARNLKLYFLKNGHGVPHYLRQVTGELRTRAPVTAAKREARRQLQDSAGEDRAAADAISVLAAGRSEPSPSGSTPDFGREDHGTTFTALEQDQTEQKELDGEAEYDEPDGEDEMVASAIQQVLAVTRGTGRSDMSG